MVVEISFDSEYSGLLKNIGCLRFSKFYYRKICISLEHRKYVFDIFHFIGKFCDFASKQKEKQQKFPSLKCTRYVKVKKCRNFYVVAKIFFSKYYFVSSGSAEQSRLWVSQNLRDLITFPYRYIWSNRCRQFCPFLHDLVFLRIYIYILETHRFWGQIWSILT